MSLQCVTSHPIHELRRIRPQRGNGVHVLQLLFKYDLVKYDMTRDEPVKDQQGFCRRVKKGRRAPLPFLVLFVPRRI